MVAPFDYLDSMAWDIAIGAVLLGIAALRLPYKASSDSVEESGKNMRMGFAAAIGVSGLYLFLTGIAISFTWPFGTPSGAQFTAPNYTGGQYNILFGGVAALAGLALLATSIALFFNGGLSIVSYFAAIIGVYAVVDAYAMINARLTRTPELAALGYLAFAVTAFLSIPATHIDNKWMRRLFAIFAFMFAIAWLYQGTKFTLGHLGVAV